MSAIEERRLTVSCDGLELVGGAYLPRDPRGVAVLLHGLPSASAPAPDDPGYRGLAERFATRGWIAVWADMRSARGAPGYFSIEGWVKDAAAIVAAARALDGAAGLPFALIGSSAGGVVSAEVVRRGTEVDALVLLAAPAAWLSFAGDPAAAARRIVDEAGMALEPAVLEDPAAWAAEFDSVVAERSIAEVRAPVLVVHGTADEVVPLEHAHRIAAAGRAELRVLEGASHFLRRDDTAIEIVLEWLERKLL